MLTVSKQLCDMQRPDFWDILWTFPLPPMSSLKESVWKLKWWEELLPKGLQRERWNEGLCLCLYLILHRSIEIFIHFFFFIILGFMETIFFCRLICMFFFFFFPPLLLWTASYNMCAGLHFHIIELRPFPLQGGIWLSWKSSLTAATFVQIQLQLLPQ